MYSRARAAGHPIHPMLVVFPIALFTSTVAALLAYVGARDPFYFRAAMLASSSGVVAALLAAIPGAIDLFALPRDSRARTTGARHASYALFTVGIFAATAALLIRGWNTRTMVGGEWQLDATIPLALSVVGMVSLVIVGSLGWTLVQTHHVGIKPARTHTRIPSREPELEGGRPALKFS